MEAWPWVLGSVVVVVTVTAPYARRPRPARDLLSRLEFELDDRAEAERCRTPAGSAPAPGAGARAERWARAGLAAIGRG
ncbi:hypothetical protein L6E12_06490 [Actinokineospora sp. PR83]|uniref:hypothetical protein n=1 Tax=Actinokineospora sp. PR83 TaxID=2884908 RepID=UPI001F32E5BC|nr:hypothetical protein [Actinokineospora sp. PR83]MCG8915433.1 hypothetical protein [Actinokineospora sp. PR83]